MSIKESIFGFFNRLYINEEEDMPSYDKESDDKEGYECECLECGHTLTTDKEHCKDIECPKCGGEMRRKDRPGKKEEDKDEADDEETDLDIPPPPPPEMLRKKSPGRPPRKKGRPKTK